MKDGIHENISIGEYHANNFIVSSTGIKKAKNSSRDFAHYLLQPQDNKSCFDFGNAFELALMDKVNGSNLFQQEVAITNHKEWCEIVLNENPKIKQPTSTNHYKELLKEFQQENSGKYIIDERSETENSEVLNNMVLSVLNDEVIRKVLKNSGYQKSLVWTDARTGLRIKTRPDVEKENSKGKVIVVDIKTTQDASPSAFARQAANLDYPLQAITQIEGVLKTGLHKKVDDYFWLAVEKKAPYHYGLYRFSQSDWDFLRTSYEFYLTRCAQVLNTIGKKRDEMNYTDFKSYGEVTQYGVIDLELPLYYKNDFN
jgi:hypothetical protein